MKKRLYIETTVVSYLTAKPSRDIMVAGHQEATRELWPKLLAKYETYISALVFVEEARRGASEQV
ncbi:MAG: type II toxin-antitoxin system VapC family toxin [Deltaproteobacteria bacterium]|nr:type II toxin-antitoxin system VapC family toxin [Deltaproteobacteria bacterium]